MLKKPDGCAGCPLQHKGIGFVPDKIVSKQKYMLWGEAPGKQEAASGEPFVGASGFVLKEWLIRSVPELQLAKERNEISYANVLRCLPPNNAQGRPYPTGEEKTLAEAHCRQYDPDLTGVHTVVLCGETPARLFFKSELATEDAVDHSLNHTLKGVMGRLGRVYEKDKRRYVLAPHPAYILRQPSLVQHGVASLRIAVGKDKVVATDYMIWEKALEEMHKM